MATALNFKNMYSNEFDKLVEKDMEPAIKHLQQELVTIRTGRSHPGLVEDIKVIVYGGTQMSLKEVATISAPEARLLIIQPWDQGTINDIEKGIMASPTGLTPANDGTVIRITLPELSSQRREELIKLLGKKLEACKDSIRDTRATYRTGLKDAEKKRDISEDFSSKMQEGLQKIHDKFIAQAEALCEKKEKEIRAV
jgi:ribosome recycling factor